MSAQGEDLSVTRGADVEYRTQREQDPDQKPDYRALQSTHSALFVHPDEVLSSHNTPVG